VFDTSGVNHALNKLATQSSTYIGHSWGSDPASKAVNGNLGDFRTMKQVFTMNGLNQICLLQHHFIQSV